MCVCMCVFRLTLCVQCISVCLGNVNLVLFSDGLCPHGHRLSFELRSLIFRRLSIGHVLHLISLSLSLFLLFIFISSIPSHDLLQGS